MLPHNFVRTQLQEGRQDATTIGPFTATLQNAHINGKQVVTSIRYSSAYSLQELEGPATVLVKLL